MRTCRSKLTIYVRKKVNQMTLLSTLSYIRHYDIHIHMRRFKYSHSRALFSLCPSHTLTRAHYINREVDFWLGKVIVHAKVIISLSNPNLWPSVQ